MMVPIFEEILESLGLLLKVRAAYRWLWGVNLVHSTHKRG